MKDEYNDTMNAEVITVLPTKVKIAVDDLEDFEIAEEKLKVGSYLKISDNENVILIAIIESFSIEVSTDKDDKPIRRYILEAAPLGVIKDGKFERGGDNIAIPPKKVQAASLQEIEQIFSTSIEAKNKFIFSTLSSNKDISIPVNGDKFFGKHIAVVGSTGSGKSHSVAKILQNVVHAKNREYNADNNSHIIIFDIHSEYKAAFPEARYIDIDELMLPYWLLNSEELQELFIDTEANDHNQRNLFKESVVKSKKVHYQGSEKRKEKISFDTPVFFDIDDVLKDAIYKNQEMVPGANNRNRVGSLNGKLDNFISRLENKINDKRLEFLLGDKTKRTTYKQTLQNLIGYGDKNANITIIDLSGVPFEVLSITVSLISRLLFDFGYYYKKARDAKKVMPSNDIPLLLVYEEAHKYVPNNDLVKYRASRVAIERIAKEGRKYGISLLLASQRPSEISETILSQCNNFLALRLTNSIDQNYIKRLLPDTLGGLIERLPSLRAGEGILVGDAIVVPSIVQVQPCSPSPASNSIEYLQIWKEEWHEAEFELLDYLI